MKQGVRFICFVLFLTVCLLGKAAGTSIVIYVSPGGNDAALGTKKDPLATLEMAWQRVGYMLGKQPVTIYLRGGRYVVRQPLVITADQSGTRECPVLIAGYPGEKAVLTASYSWEGLSWSYYRDGIWQVKVDLGNTVDCLFVNGQLQQMARYPNYDSEIAILNGHAEDVLSEERVAGWKNPAGAYIHAIHEREWGGCHYRVVGKDASGGLQMEGGFQNNRPMGMHKTFRMVENVFEELDAPGEWYYEKTTKTLFFYPPKGLNLDKVLLEVPQTESVFQLRGDEDRLVSDVHLRNLSITQTCRTFMKTAEPLLRSDWCIYRGGAVVFEQTERCSLEECDLYDLGGNAVFFSNRNRHGRVYANHIYNIGGSAVCYVGSPRAVRQPLFSYGAPFVNWENMDREIGPLTDDYPFECTADNNLIHDIGLIEKQVAGVQISMSRRITVSYNSIYNVPRAGINISEGTWGGHLIKGNDVFNTVLETGDHGAFNSWGRDRFWSASWNLMVEQLKDRRELVLADAMETNVLCDNRFQCSHGWDIDLDDGSSNYHIYNNVCLEGGLKLREGFYRKVENNVILNNTFHPHVWFEHSGDVFCNNIVTTGYRPVAIRHWGEKVDMNFFFSPTGLQEAQQRGTDSLSLCGDPLFICPEKGDYRVSKCSPALRVGFKNFDMKQVGVQVARLKKQAAHLVLPPLSMDWNSEEEQPIYSWRGLSLRNVTSDGERSAAGLDAARGVWVQEVGTNKDGFRENDVVVRFHGKTIFTWHDISSQLNRCAAGEIVTVSVMREQKLHKIEFRF